MLKNRWVIKPIVHILKKGRIAVKKNKWFVRIVAIVLAVLLAGGAFISVFSILFN